MNGKANNTSQDIFSEDSLFYKFNLTICRMTEQIESPNITISDEQFIKAGFTSTGISRFKGAVIDYSRRLYEKSVHFGDISKAQDLPREITHENVQSAATSIARFGRLTHSNWFKAAKIIEYIGIAVAGLGSGHLDNPLGILAFGGGLTAAIVLYIYRTIQMKEED